MPVFFGEMKHADHPKKLPAVVHVDKGNIRLQSGKTVLGEWKLYEVQIEERDPQTISFRVDDDEVLLNLQQHESFLAETASARVDPRRQRRAPTHEAFRKPDEGPTLGEEIREDVTKEVTGVVDEIKALWESVYVGTPFWIGVGVFALAVVFGPAVLVGLLFVVGVVSLVVGAIAYVESSLAVKLPGSLTPTRLIAVGVVAIGLGIVVSLIR